VVGADRLEVLPRLTVPVATTAHLIALKVLAGPSQDLALIRSALDHEDLMPLRGIVPVTEGSDMRAVSGHSSGLPPGCR
jgi:hypothetical protein